MERRPKKKIRGLNGVAFIEAICNGLQDRSCAVRDAHVVNFGIVLSSRYFRQSWTTQRLLSEISIIDQEQDQQRKSQLFMELLAGAAVEASSLFSVGYTPTMFLHQSFVDRAATQ